MMQAIKSIQYLKVHFLFPKHVITGDEATHRMAKAVEAWTNWNFQGFGQEIGKLLREFVLLMYPQQYFVDPTGRLRRQLNGKSCDGRDCIKVAGWTLGPSFVAFIVGGVSMSMFVALVAVRGLRSMSHRESAVHPDGSDVENFLEVE